MLRLMNAGFARLFKNAFFRLCIVLSAGLGMFLDVMRYLDIQRNAEIYAKLGSEYRSADGFVFSGLLYLIFMIAPFVSLFIGTEYSDGTIRNKIMVGRNRWAVYLSNLIVCTAGNLIMVLTFILVTLGFGIILFKVSCLTVFQIAVFTLSQCAAVIGLSAILVALSMLIQSRSAGSVALILLTIILLFSALSISSKLEQTEYYEEDPIVFQDAETGEITIKSAMVKNPGYITGKKREVYVFLNRFLPVNQIYYTTQHQTDDLGIMAVYSVVNAISGTVLGIILFRKKDLK